MITLDTVVTLDQVILSCPLQSPVLQMPGTYFQLAVSPDLMNGIGGVASLQLRLVSDA